MSEKKQALDGRRMNMFGMDPDDIIIVGRDTEDGPEHPLWRKTATEAPDPSKVASIKSIGVISPVALMKVEVTIKGKKVKVAAVSAGRGRVVAGREAKRHGWDGEVPCVVLQGDEGTQLAIGAAENAVRRAPDPLEQADDVVRLSNMQWSAAKIAGHLGMTQNRVRDLLKVVETAAPVRKMVEQGLMSASAAADLADLPREQQLEAVAAVKESLGTGAAGDKPRRATVREVRKVAAKAAGREHVHALSGKQLQAALKAVEALAGGSGTHEERCRARGARDALLMTLGQKPKIEDDVTKAIGEAVGS